MDNGKGEESEAVLLTADERLEYEDLSTCSRHDDDIIYQAASVCLPLAFGAVAVAAEFPTMAWQLGVFSVVLYLYWLVIATRMSWFTSVRRTRQRELEAKAGMMHHSRLDRPPTWLTRKCGARISIRVVRWAGLVVLLVAWFITIGSI